MIKTKIQQLLFLLSAAIVLGSCNYRDVYNNCIDFPSDEWQRDFNWNLPVDIQDTVSLYDVYINVRNTGNYRFQNLWLFIDITAPDGAIYNRDSIDFYLADNSGKWLGSGVGEVRDMPVLFLENYKFNASGNYNFQIIHGMRCDTLKGIRSVGLQIVKSTNQ